MNFKEQMEFEIMIYEMIERFGIKSTEDLQGISEKLHSCIENAISDYATENGIEDYEPYF